MLKKNLVSGTHDGGLNYEKIAVAFLFVLIGFFTPTFVEVFDDMYFELFLFLPYIGIPLAIWGLFDKK